MTPEMMTQTRALLIKHEADKKRAYLDPITSDITVGIGHNLSARDVEDDIRSRWFNQDTLEFYHNWVTTFPWFKDLNEARQIALIDFSFQGWKHVLGFEKMLGHLSRGEMKLAAEELLNSEYGRKLPLRAKDLANILITGEIYV